MNISSGNEVVMEGGGNIIACMASPALLQHNFTLNGKGPELLKSNHDLNEPKVHRMFCSCGLLQFFFSFSGFKNYIKTCENSTESFQPVL